jgi:hypothetical protein
MYYYAQSIGANEQVCILDSNYRPITDPARAESIFLANFDQEVYILTSN